MTPEEFNYKINQVIVHLMAIANFAKDIHYNCKGEAFYSKHLLADRVQENIYDYIDGIKETFFLASDTKTLSSREYLMHASGIIPDVTGTDTEDFKELAKLITKTLKLIQNLDSLSIGEENLIGNIAENLQNSIGLINRQIK